MAFLSDEEIGKMIDRCEEQLAKAYCVYSNFPVAAVLVTDCGKVFSGCNVENASYGLSICAERTASVKAVSEGFRNIKACFVLTRSPGNVAPCGACRQFLAEFNLNMDIYLIGKDRKYRRHLLRDLLPLAFGPKDLEENSLLV